MKRIAKSLQKVRQISPNRLKQSIHVCAEVENTQALGRKVSKGRPSLRSFRQYLTPVPVGYRSRRTRNARTDPIGEFSNLICRPAP